MAVRAGGESAFTLQTSRRRRLGYGILFAALLLAAASLSANRFTGGSPAFGSKQQLGLAVAALVVVGAVWLVSASWEATLVTGIAAITLIARLTTLDQMLAEAHGFRQTQTAYTAVLFNEEGIDLLHPKLPVLGAPFEVPFEFPLFQALAVVPLKLELPADTAMRLTGLACFIATGLLLYGLLRHVAGPAVGVAGLIAFAASPFAQLWSRVSLIEYLATAGAVGFAWATIRWREDRRIGHAALALLAGSIAMLVKPTTGLFWLLPALAWRPPGVPRFRDWARSLASPTLAAIVTVPFLLALLWTRHADAIKSAHEATAWLTSQHLQDWNFGSLSDREQFANWSTIWGRFADWIIGPALALLPIAAVAAWRSRQRFFWLAMTLAVVLPPATFFNLYIVHDYYLAAVTPAAAALIGLGVGWLWNQITDIHGRAVVTAAAAVLVFWTLDATAPYWKAAYRPAAGFSGLSTPLAEATRPDELVMVAGLGWSPEILYYARRKGIALDGDVMKPSFLAKQRTRYHVLASVNPTVDPLPEVLSFWPWIGVIGGSLYSMGDRPEQIPGSAVSATDNLEAFRAASRRGRVLPAPREPIGCGGDTSLPAGRAGTWLRIEADRQARVSIGDFSPIPARRVMAVAPISTDSIRITCVGTDHVTIAEVVDAPVAVRCAPPRPIRWPRCS